MIAGSEVSRKLSAVAGIRVAAVESNIRYKNRLDLVLFELAPGSRVAGVFTRNAFCAAPVVLAKKHLESSGGSSRYLLINTGNANAGTGEKGMQDAVSCCTALAEAAGVPLNSVLPFSTGVIGENLPVEKIRLGIPKAISALADNNWSEAAKGIMTTDTHPKSASAVITVGNKPVTLTGIAKGAGMIKPNMATMLSFIATDAVIEQPLLQKLLEGAVKRSFNRITVDGDTSTNDACILVASGSSAIAITEADADNFELFNSALQGLLLELAQSIIRDAEGAKKFVTVDVREGGNSEECLMVAYAIAESPLVKTALSASDPNWGRILAAVGRAGVPELDVSRIHISLGDVSIVENGTLAPTYTEAAGQTVMNQADIDIIVRLARGSAQERVWTSDLSEEYVRINASYRS
jgi:glutamate N-acetyltransferase / amino-acid N-acetyltransferase